MHLTPDQTLTLVVAVIAFSAAVAGQLVGAKIAAKQAVADRGVDLDKFERQMAQELRQWESMQADRFRDEKRSLFSHGLTLASQAERADARDVPTRCGLLEEMRAATGQMNLFDPLVSARYGALSAAIANAASASIRRPGRASLRANAPVTRKNGVCEDAILILNRSTRSASLPQP